MDQLEGTFHSFVIRVWLEEIAVKPRGATWRGHITHVPSGERRYLHNLDEAAAFIAPYLEEMGVKFGIGWRVKQWLKRQKLPWKTRA